MSKRKKIYIYKNKRRPLRKATCTHRVAVAQVAAPPSIQICAAHCRKQNGSPLMCKSARQNIRRILVSRFRSHAIPALPQPQPYHGFPALLRPSTLSANSYLPEALQGVHMDPFQSSGFSQGPSRHRGVSRMLPGLTKPLARICPTPGPSMNYQDPAYILTSYTHGCRAPPLHLPQVAPAAG